MRKSDLIGRQVLIIGDHPHAGRVGIIEDIQIAKAINKPGLIIRFNDWNEDSAFVFDKKNLKFI